MENLENFYDQLPFDLIEDQEKESNTVNGIVPVKEGIVLPDDKHLKVDLGKTLEFFHPEKKCIYCGEEDNGLLWVDSNRKNILITNLIRVNTEHIDKIGIGKFVYVSRSEDIDLGMDNIIVNFKTLLPCSIDGKTYLNESFNQYVTSVWKTNIQEIINSNFPRSYTLIYLWKVFSHIFKLKGLREITLSIKNEDPVTPSVSYSLNYMEFLKVTNDALFSQVKTQ